MPRDHRRLAARIVAALAAVFWGFLWFGLIDLLVVVLQDEEFHQHYLLESGWGLLYLVLVTVPLIRLVRRPGEPVALAQLALVTLCVAVGAVWRWSLPPLWNALGLAATVAVLAWLGRGRLAVVHRPDALSAALAVVALPAAVAYGAPLIDNRFDLEDITNGVSHYPMQASLALAIAALAALAAVTGSRLPAWTAAFAAAWLGVESMVYPDLTGSLGTLAGALTIVWAAAVVTAAELSTRRAGPRIRQPD